ncbi:MAG: glycosyltransferase family 2 protein [Coriobacteriia bacterium]|nr:glycosyltransferase family 2 protein [Coriobacteriia bacterium]
MSEVQQPCDVSIVVVSFNTRDDLSELLDDLSRVLEESRNAVRVVVVDNGSTDGSARSVRERHAAFHLVEAGENLGFPRACNIGMESSPARFHLLLNPDTRIQPRDVDRLVECAEEVGPGLFGPLILLPDGRVQPSCFREPTLANILAETTLLRPVRPLIPSRFRRELPAPQHGCPSCVPVLLGAAVLVSDEVIAKVGPLDEEYFWMEFSEFCARAARAGFPSWFVPDSRVIHKEGRARRRFRLVSTGSYLLSERRFFSVHRTPWQSSAMRALRHTELLLKWALLAVAGLVSPTARARRGEAERLLEVYSRPLATWRDLL